MHRARRTTTTSADHRSSNRIATGVIALTALIWATLGISISAPARASSPAGASSSADASSSIGASSSADANSSADADPPGTAAITDPALVAEVVAAARRHTEGASRTSVAVDVVGKQAGQAASAVIAIGGMVTGSVPGALVQATVPFDRVADLARIDGVEFVRASRPANQRPRRSESVGYGPSVNDGVAAMNATAWQDAGFRGGGTRIGIIDFFTVDSWNTTEQGPRPTLANGHMFCRDSLQTGLCNADGSINSAQGDQHGLAVTEIVKDTAPDADVYIASVNTVSDMRAAVDWFAANGVSIVTRSLGSAYDGPGDGTGPLDSVVDYAASLGITWFNSAGNDAGTGYMRVVVPSNNGSRAVEFAPGDTLLRLDGDSNGCFQLDGIRWANDWYLPPAQRTDYRVEVYQPTSRFAAGGLHTNPSMPLPVDLWPQIPGTQNVVDANQRGGAPPLEMADQFWCTNSGISYLRIVPNPATPIGSVPDVLEIASTNRDLEYDSDPHGSAAKPVVDSANHNLVAVGALASPNANDVAYYSSQGPTTDGRIKPDLVAPSCVTSTVYAPGCFAGTSAASPAAAGVAALIRSAGLAANGESLVALVMHFTADLLAPGRDNASGAGKISLPPPPVPSTPGDAAQYNVVVPTRLLDTRVSSPVGPPNLIGPQPERGILDLPVTGSNSVPAAGVSAVALNITSVDSLTTNFVQALPTMQGVVGATSTLNVAVSGAPRPNFAIVPVGQDGRITLYMPAGGNVVVDLLGYFSPPSSVPPSAVPPSAGPGSASPVSASPVSAGRFVSLRPERWIDSRDPAVLPPELTAPRLVAGGETITVSRLPTTAVPATGVAALVVNVTSDGATLAGYLRAQPTGSSGLSNSTVNYVAGIPAANTSIVGLGDGSTISVYALRPTNVIVDVVGYITSNDAPQSSAGLFIALTPGRNFDSRSGAPFADGSTHVIGLTQLGSPATLVPADAGAVSANLTAVQGASVGFVTVWADGSRPATSSLNFTANDPVANGTLMQLAADGSVSVFVNRQAHVIIDVNGYFTGPR